MMKKTEIQDFLREKGIMPSPQRVEIYKYLRDNKNHPTVDMIYKDLVQKFSSLSKTTVYNTLKFFVEHNVAIEIIIDKNEIRYDADISVHGHFYCKECKEIFDFKINTEKIIPEILKDAKLDEHHFYIKGVCGQNKLCNKD